MSSTVNINEKRIFQWISCLIDTPLQEFFVSCGRSELQRTKQPKNHWERTPLETILRTCAFIFQEFLYSYFLQVQRVTCQYPIIVCTMNVADHHIGNQHRKSYAETAAPPRWIKFYLLHFRRSDQLNSCYDDINGRRSYKNPFKDE